MFASLEAIRPEVLILWQLFSHNVCLYDIYQHLWRYAVFSKPKKVTTEKLKICRFPRFLRSEVAMAVAMRSLLLPNCEGSHSVRLYRAANSDAAIPCSHWSIYRSLLHWYSSLQMTFAFKTHNQIRQFWPLWRRFDQKYLFCGNYYYHTICVFTISIYTFDGMLSFSNRKKLPRKNWIYAVFPGFCARKLQTFYQIVCLVFFFLYFLFLVMDLRRLVVLLHAFECACQL